MRIVEGPLPGEIRVTCTCCGTVLDIGPEDVSSTVYSTGPLAGQAEMTARCSRCHLLISLTDVQVHYLANP